MREEKKGRDGGISDGWGGSGWRRGLLKSQFESWLNIKSGVWGGIRLQICFFLRREV